MLKNGAICVKTYRHLRQITLPFASSYEVKSMSLCGELTEMTTKEDKTRELIDRNGLTSVLKVDFHFYLVVS